MLTDPELFSLQSGLRHATPRGGSYGMAEFSREPDRTFVAPIYEIRSEDWRRFAEPGDRAVVVLRDPRDSIVSWAFSVAYSHVTEEHIRIIRPVLLALDLRGKLEVAMYTFWESSAAQRSWARKANTTTELILTYEEIVANELAAFERIVTFFGWSVPATVLRAVVERLSFKTRSGRARGEKNEFSHYRNGVAGDWRSYFDRDLAKRFEDACPGLLVDLGYENDPNWWSSVPEHIPALDEGALAAHGELANAKTRIERLERENAILDDLARDHLRVLEEAAALAQRR